MFQDDSAVDCHATWHSEASVRQFAWLEKHDSKKVSYSKERQFLVLAFVYTHTVEIYLTCTDTIFICLLAPVGSYWPLFLGIAKQLPDIECMKQREIVAAHWV